MLLEQERNNLKDTVGKLYKENAAYQINVKTKENAVLKGENDKLKEENSKLKDDQKYKLQKEMERAKQECDRLGKELANQQKMYNESVLKYETRLEQMRQATENAKRASHLPKSNKERTANRPNTSHASSESDCSKGWPSISYHSDNEATLTASTPNTSRCSSTSSKVIHVVTSGSSSSSSSSPVTTNPATTSPATTSPTTTSQAIISQATISPSHLNLLNISMR